MKLIFATYNQHKVNEIRAVLPSPFEVISLTEAGIAIDLPEPYETLHENAASKARIIYQMSCSNCFSEDSGLEVAELNGAPGVHSARYAGAGKSPEANISLLLENMTGQTSRKGRFRTVICLIWEGQERYFEGTCEGRISLHPVGEKGFGYDPVFIPEGSDKTFAQIDMSEKNRYSHRKKAADRLVTFLNELK